MVARNACMQSTPQKVVAQIQNDGVFKVPLPLTKQNNQNEENVNLGSRVRSSP
jgi:hypothetical protein